MTVIKRNGAEVPFDIHKISAAIAKANATVEKDIRMTSTQIQRIAEAVELSCRYMDGTPTGGVSDYGTRGL